MFVERKVRSSGLFSNFVGWHASTVSFPLSDVILAQLGYPLNEVMFYLHSGIPNYLSTNIESSLMDLLHWQDLYAKMPTISCCNIAFLTCLGHLGRCDTDRIVSISCHVAQGDQGKGCFMSLSLATMTSLSCNLCQCKHGLMKHILGATL